MVVRAKQAIISSEYDEKVVSEPMSLGFLSFVFFTALFWMPTAPTEPDEDEVEDYDEALKAYTKKRRSYAVWLLIRLAAVFGGGLLLVITLFTEPLRLDDSGGFALLLGMYSLLLLGIQRAENNRRIITAVFMIFCALLMERFAAFRGYDLANHWALYGALLLNYAFWFLIGQRFPVGSSQDIEVWGMDA